MFILVAEADANFRQAIDLMLCADGHRTMLVDDSETALAVIKDYEFDIVLLGMPNLLAGLRARAATPIVVISEMDGVDDKVHAFRAGADDYLVRPFHRDELLARIQAVARRSRGHSTSIINVGALAINLDERTISVNDLSVYVSATEFKILEFLALRLGKAMSQERFISYLYSGLDEPQPKIIDVYICKLRRRLANVSGGLNFIRTVYGSGYLLQDGAAA